MPPRLDEDAEGNPTSKSFCTRGHLSCSLLQCRVTNSSPRYRHSFPQVAYVGTTPRIRGDRYRTCEQTTMAVMIGGEVIVASVPRAWGRF